MSKDEEMRKEYEEMKEKLEKIDARTKRAYRRRQVRIDLTLKKAFEAGIKVSEKEVDAEFEKKYKTK